MIPGRVCCLCVRMGRPYVYVPQTGSIINLKIDNWIKALPVCWSWLFLKHRLIVWLSEFIGFSTNILRKNEHSYHVGFCSLLFYWQITLLFFLLKVALMHFNTIWLCFYSSLWFLHFLTTFFRHCQKSYSQSACLNRRGLRCYTSFLFIEVGPLPGDISERYELLCNVPFLSIFAIIYWL